MVFLATTKNSATEAIEISKQIGAPTWVGSDSISAEDHQDLVKAGINVTGFAYPLENASLSVLEGAFATVEEHHPRETIWLAANLGCGMKNIQVIDGAANCVYDIFAATEREFEAIFPGDQNIAFLDDVYTQETASRLDPVLESIWRRPVPKCDAVGIHGILFYQLDEKKKYYPTRRDEEAINPDGSALRAWRRKPEN